MTERELHALDWFQNHFRTNGRDLLMTLLSKSANNGFIWLLLTMGLVLFSQTRRTGCALGLSLALEAACCNLLLKPMIARPRSCDRRITVQLLVPKPLGPSFPSGHTAASFASAAALYFSQNWLWLPATLLAVGIGLSRLYLYVHYPSDVAAGALLGIIFGALGVLLVYRLY